MCVLFCCVDKKMVDKLNRSGREFEGDKEKIRLEFSRIPANLDVEVLNLPPDVNPTRLRRFFFALRSAPLVKDIIVSPEKENAFVVKLRTESGRFIYLQKFLLTREPNVFI